MKFKRSFVFLKNAFLKNTYPPPPKWFKIEGACRPRTLGMFRLRYEMNKFTVNYCSRSTICLLTCWLICFACETVHIWSTVDKMELGSFFVSDVPGQVCWQRVNNESVTWSLHKTSLWTHNRNLYQAQRIAKKKFPIKVYLKIHTLEGWCRTVEATWLDWCTKFIQTPFIPLRSDRLKRAKATVKPGHTPIPMGH